MAKFAALLIAAVAVQAVFAGSVQQNPHVVKAAALIHSVGKEAVSSVESVKPDEHQGKHALSAIAAVYAHQLEVVVHHLHHAVLLDHDGHGHEVIEQVAKSISDVAHQIQQVVHADPAQIKNVVKTSIEAVATEVDKLVPVAHQLHSQQDHDNVDEEVEHSVYEILEAVRVVHIRAQLQLITHQKAKEHIQGIITDVSNVIQSIDTNDKETAHELVLVAHQLSHVLGREVDHLHNDVHHHEGEAKNVIQQVTNKLNEIHVSLEEIINSHGQANVQARVTELKNQLKTNIHNVAVQIERLIQLAQSGNQTKQDDQEVSNLVKNVVADIVATIRNVHTELQVISEH